MACEISASGVNGMDLGWPDQWCEDVTGDSLPQSHLPDVL